MPALAGRDRVKNRGRPWPREREGPAPQEWEGFSF